MLSINKYNCLNSKHNTAVYLIKNSVKTVEMMVYRLLFDFLCILLYRSPYQTEIMKQLFEEMHQYIKHNKIELGNEIQDVKYSSETEESDVENNENQDFVDKNTNIDSTMPELKNEDFYNPKLNHKSFENNSGRLVN